jgi:DNA-binding NarL/FixJ family response regulator
MRILIVDDHPVMRGGIRISLQGFDTATEAIEAADLEEAVHAARRQGPFDLVLLDLKLPAVSGVETLLAFRKAVDPCPPVVVFSATDDRATVIAALDAGAMGFIPKTSTPALLQSALQLVLAKGIYVPPTVLGREEPRRAAKPAPAARPLRKLSELGLTPRQQGVCALIVKGRSVKEIARQLGVSPATVKAHVQPILRALGVVNRTEAIVALHRLGISLETETRQAD